MATNFPSSLDSLTNPTANSDVATVDHAAQHANANDAIEALEAKVGADGSAVTSSHTYKLSGVNGSDKAASLTGEETLANKTLDTPTIEDFSDANHNHQGDAGGGQLNASSVFSTGALPLARGGTGASLVDPNADRILFWDDSAGTFTFLEIGTGLQISGTTLNATGTTPTCVTSVPKPVGLSTASGTQAFAVNTTQWVGLVNVPTQITVNKVSVNITAVGTSGTLDIVVYSEDGQTQYINVTTASISGTGKVTTSVGSVVLPAGNYYIGINPNSTADITLTVQSVVANDLRDISSEPVLVGTIAISAGTPATTFNPVTNIATGTAVPLVRLDN